MWDRKITQTVFGPQVGIEQSNLAKKLRGVRGWSLDEVQRVALELDTTVSYLVGETKDPRRPKPGGGPGGHDSRDLRPERDSNAQPTGLLSANPTFAVGYLGVAA